MQASQYKDIHLKFFDANTGNAIENTTFSMKVIKENKILLSNAFWTESGSFTFHLKFGDRYLWNANPDHDPMDGLYYSKGDQIDIDSSYLSEGPYHIEIQPLVYVVGNTSQPYDGIKFDTDLDPSGNDNKTIPQNTIIIPSENVVTPPQTPVEESIVLTPFDVSFLKNDFNRTGVSHQILILKPNQTADIHVMVSNNDNKTHDVYLQIPKENLENFVSSYSFDPSSLRLYPHLSNETILHVTTANINDTQTGVVGVLVQDNSFGKISKAFYLAVGNNIPDSRLDWIDKALREAMPGIAFENIRPFALEGNTTIIPNNVFGMPTYLPQGYKLQGFSSYGPGPMLIYSPVQVANTTQEIDFLHSGGIIAYYEVNNPSFNLKNWMPDYIAQNEAQEVMVNNITGVAIDQQNRQTDDYKFKSSAQITLFKGNSELEIVGNIPLSELLKVASSIPISGVSQAVSPQCVADEDWPGKPCNDEIDTQNPNQKPIFGGKQDWKVFYDMKGKDWMESKKQEMYYADQNRILKEWYEYGSHSGHLANADVWYYYNLYGESPDIMKYYNGTVQKNWAYPIITYYYASPIIFVIIGAVSVAGFFISRKILVKIRK